MTTGMIMSPCAADFELKSLQKPMMFTPCWPSAGPTGGEGFAFPAGSCSLTIPVTFFISTLLWWCERLESGLPPWLRLLHLHEVQLDRRGAAEDRDQHPHAALVRVHFLDGAVEVRERPVH